MVNTRFDDAWKRRGLTILWNFEALAEIAEPSQVISLRKLIHIAKSWPEELPAADGNAVVVTGLEGMLDSLATADAATWLEGEFKDLILDFQSEYQGYAALIFWVPAGNKRLKMKSATEEYFWQRVGSKEELHIGRLIWAGAEREVERILRSEDPKPDIDSDAYIGLHHPRIS